MTPAKSMCFLLIVLLSICKICEGIEVLCVVHNDNECEVDPTICQNLNDKNTAEDTVIIPSYENVKDSTTLDILSPTNLTTVPRFVLRKFPKLRQIRMINTGITTLNAENFVSGHNLIHLDLRRNEITTIAGKTFADLNHLENINLAYNKIARIEPHAFDHVLALKTMILSDNLLQTIETECFTGAKNLVELDLESNNIFNIESGALNLPKLEVISLKDNRLSSLPNGIFANSPKIEQIDLSNNDLIEIGDLFKGMKNLYSLSLSDNPELKDGDLFRLTQQIPNLSYLSLANTDFKLTNKLKLSNEPNYSLTHLNLSANNLSTPDILMHFTQFKSLKTIILNNNQFTHLNHIALLKGLFPRLVTIQLKYNEHIQFDWLRHAQIIFQKQKIEVVTEHQITIRSKSNKISD